MAVICIARELGTLGDEVVYELASRSGYTSIDKTYVETKMTNAGVSTEVRIKYDEKKPGFFAALSQDRDNYIHYLKTILYAEAAKGDCIVVGRGGFALFADVPGVLCVKLVASRSERVKRLAERFQCNEKHAERLLKQSDKDRLGFHEYFFSADWNDPSYYHLVINTDKSPPKRVAEIIDLIRKETETKAEKEACARRVAELNLAQAVISAVIYKQRLPIHFLEADVEGNAVTLHGVANTQNALEAAAEAAKQVSGVDSVKNAIQLVHEFGVMP